MIGSRRCPCGCAPTRPRAGLECADHVQDTVSSAASSTFDAGLPRGATDWVADGHLRALVTTRHSAGLAGIAHTPFVDNLLAGVAGTLGNPRRPGRPAWATACW